jgi:predicted extracellular nuclease
MAAKLKYHNCIQHKNGDLQINTYNIQNYTKHLNKMFEQRFKKQTDVIALLFPLKDIT